MKRELKQALIDWVQEKIPPVKDYYWSETVLQGKQGSVAGGLHQLFAGGHQRFRILVTGAELFTSRK